MGVGSVRPETGMAVDVSRMADDRDLVSDGADVRRRVAGLHVLARELRRETVVKCDLFAHSRARRLLGGQFQLFPGAGLRQ